MSVTQESNSPAGILSRVHFPDAADLSAAEACFILQIGFSENDRAAIHDLLVKNREGTITPAEKDDLSNFLSVSYFFDILHSKARLALQRAGQSGTAA